MRLFNSENEHEIKTLHSKELKGANGVFSLDIKRVKGLNLLHIVAGHQKGQVALYEVKGLPKNPGKEKSNLLHMISFRNIKTISDIHSMHVTQCKFYGEFKREVRQINVVSCDLEGTVYLSKFTEQILGYTCSKQCFWRRRLNGPALNISPRFYDFEQCHGGNVGLFNQ